MDSKGFLKRNFNNPVFKDTQPIPTGGYVVLRFIADNPGFWLFHCHIEFHAESGMALMFKVGDTKDMPSKPKDWPNCASFSNKDGVSSLINGNKISFWQTIQNVINSIINFFRGH